MSDSIYIGIDLGTTNSCAAVHDGKRPQVIRSHQGYCTIPSVFTYSREGFQIVGQQAERQMVLRPQDCIYGSKRLLGRVFASGTCERFQSYFAYRLVSDDNGFIAAQIGEEVISFVDVSAQILKEIRDSAESATGKRVAGAVVTVPAYFNENQRSLVREAGKLADLNVSRIINEPSAAALAFGAQPNEGKRILVFDLGGGTFDVSIVEIEGGTLKVIGVDGDTFLGGLDFDRRLAKVAQQKLRQRFGKAAELDAVGHARLMVAVRNAKHELSQQPRAKIEIRCLGLADKSTVNVNEEVTVEEYLFSCNDLLEQLRTVVKRSLDRARLQSRDIDDVLLVGGQTRMPAVQQLIRELLGREPNKGIHPDEVVALGAAIAAFDHDQESATVLRDMLPIPIGTASIVDHQFFTIFPRNTPLPAEMVVQVKARVEGSTLKWPLFQGEGSHALDNELLGVVVINGLPASREPVEYAVILKLDVEGLLSVLIRKPGMKKDQPVRLITNERPNELLAEMIKADVQTLIPEQSAPKEFQKKKLRMGTARIQDQRSGLWQRIWGWFRRE